MKRICAWCSREMGANTNDAVGSPIEGHNKMEDISHGICTECLEKRNKEIEELKKFEKILSDDELRSFVATAILRQFTSENIDKVYNDYKVEISAERIFDLLQKNSEVINKVSSNLHYIIRNLLLCDLEKVKLKQ